MNLRRKVSQFRADCSGFSAAEAALLACLLGATCIVVGLNLSQGAATAADHVDSEIATGSPTQRSIRPPLAWQIPIKDIQRPSEIQWPAALHAASASPDRLAAQVPPGLGVSLSAVVGQRTAPVPRVVHASSASQATRVEQAISAQPTSGTSGTLQDYNQYGYAATTLFGNEACGPVSASNALAIIGGFQGDGCRIARLLFDYEYVADSSYHNKNDCFAKDSIKNWGLQPNSFQALTEATILQEQCGGLISKKIDVYSIKKPVTDLKGIILNSKNKLDDRNSKQFIVDFWGCHCSAGGTCLATGINCAKGQNTFSHFARVSHVTSNQICIADTLVYSKNQLAPETCFLWSNFEEAWKNAEYWANPTGPQPNLANTNELGHLLAAEYQNHVEHFCGLSSTKNCQNGWMMTLEPKGSAPKCTQPQPQDNGCKSQCPSPKICSKNLYPGRLCNPS